MRLLACTLIVALVSLPTLAYAADWVLLARSLRDSIVEIASTQGACTGFVIHSKAKAGNEDVDYILTAAHCDGPELVADLRPTKVKAKDIKNDLMVLEVSDLDRPALRLANTDASIGEEVASYGYGYALDQPFFRVAHISAKNVNIGAQVLYHSIDASFIPGQSGGPVVNDRGEVTMIVQLGSNVAGFGVGAEQIRDRVGRFFEPR